MVMRIGGLASGMDIDALVEKLMNAERAPLNKLEQKKQTYEWQRDAYRGVNTQLKTFDTYIADNLVLKTLNSKTASSSNESLVKATATGKATGTLSIDGVSQLATSTSAVGEQKPFTNTMKLSEVLGTVPSKIELGSINSSGGLSERVAIELTNDMTVDQFVSKINSSNAGLTAVFENGQFSITTKNTGRVATGESAISMDSAAKGVFATFGITDAKIKEGQNARFIVNGIATERSSNSFSINGYNVALNSTFNELATFSAFGQNAVGSLTTTEKQLNDTITGLAGTSKYNVDLSAAVATATMTVEDVKYNMLSQKIKEEVTAKSTALETKNNELKSAKSISFNTTNAKDFLNILTDDQKSKFQTKALSESEIDALGLTEDQKNKYNALTEADKQSLTKTAGSVYDSLSDKAKAFAATMSHGADLTAADLTEAEKEVLKNLSEAELNNIKTVHEKQEAVKGASEELTAVTKDLNNINAKYTDYQKAVSTILTAGSAPTQSNVVPSVTLSSTTNVDDMMTKIKDFVTTYNGLVKGLTDQTKESKYRDYAPLTAEQKKDMDKDEIKLWEEKAKSGLLRNDQLIRNGLSNMRSLIYQSNPTVSDSRYNTLFSIGITTSKNYNDGGTLEIDEAKLRKALEENPDAVEQLFKNAEGKKEDTIQVTEKDKNGVEHTVTKTVDTRGYLDKLRESMKALEINIEKKAGRSTMTDAQFSIGKSLIDTNKRLDTWQDKLKTIEARYWKQFTAMESAINKGNQQSSLFMQG